MSYLYAMENINIETEIFPEAGKLLFNEDSQAFESVILDAEFDPLDCTFHCDDTVIINTNGYEYIQLDRHSLKTMLKLLASAMAQYEEMDLVDED